MTEAPGAPAYADPALYDLIYSWYQDDVDYYVGAARDAGGPVLEIACGTGRILLPSLEAGADIQGIDVEPAMLERLRAKAAARGLRADVHAGDMRDFTMPRRYRLITIPFRAFLHLHTIEDQIAALRCIREHLEPGGALTFNVFFPSYTYVLEHDGKRGLEREIVDPETRDRYAIWSTPRYDVVNQRLTSHREIVGPLGGADPPVRHTGFTLRWIFRWEAELLLRAAGFLRYHVAGGFDGRPLAHESDEMVWTAWRD